MAALVENTPLLREFRRQMPYRSIRRGMSRNITGRRHGTTAVNTRGRLVLACGRLVPYKGFDVLVRARRRPVV